MEHKRKGWQRSEQQFFWQQSRRKGRENEQEFLMERWGRSLITFVFLNYDIRLPGESGAEEGFFWFVFCFFEDFRRIRRRTENHPGEWKLSF